MATIPARSNSIQAVQYLRAPLSFNDGITAVVPVGTLPAKAIVLRTYIVVSTLYNYGTTNTIKIGTTASDASFGTGIALTAVGVITGGTALATSSTVNPTADTSVIATYTCTGTAATTGAGYAIVEYLPVE
jgi:hypothetical protein